MNNIVLIGMPGSGKTSVGKSLARMLKMRFVDTDEKLENDTGRSIPDIFAKDREETFRALETNCVYSCAQMQNTVISTGGGVVLRKENMDALARNGRIVWLNRPIAEIAATNLSDRPLVGEDVRRVYALFAAREPLYKKYAEITVINKGTVYGVTTRLISMLPRRLHLAVIGDPITRTKSPQIHHALAQLAGLDVCYEAVKVQKEELADFFTRVKQESIDGFNITIPHKSAVIPYLTEIDPYAASCGAVNTVTVKEGKLTGYNTDGDGVLCALERLGVKVKGKRVTLLGSGGAALSICRRCSLAGAETVNVLCRSRYKAEPMQYPDGKLDRTVLVDSMTSQTMRTYAEKTDILINATPLGMSDMPDDFTDFGFLDALPEGAVVYDIVYKPPVTTLLSECQKRGIRCGNGLSMLIFQAIYAFEHFAGVKLDKDTAYAAVEKALQENMD